MGEALVIGSGPSGVGVATALAATGRHRVTVIDPGATLEPDRQAMLASVADRRPSEWDPGLREELARQPVSSASGELPEKRVFGSDFVFRNRGQLDGLNAVGIGNRHAVSAAVGGFSNVWGAQIMPFSRETVDQWPVRYDELVPHYEAVLRHVPLAAVADDYTAMFPLLSPQPRPLPTLAPPAAAALGNYARRRSWARRLGITMGSARLALRADECIECGLCMTGCPRGLIYSAADTVRELRSAGQIDHRSGLLALKVGEDHQGPWVSVRDLDSGGFETLRADHIFVACGGIGTTRLMLGSARPDVRELELEESVQMVLPFISARRQADPRSYDTFTLNQFNILVEYGRGGLDMAHFHLYPYNPAFDEALPRAITASATGTREVLRRTVAALGYLPSWDSPRVGIRVDGRGDVDGLPGITIDSKPNPRTAGALRRVFARLLGFAPGLDLWPGLPVMRLSGAAKSYHFGGSFRHVDGAPRVDRLETDRLGRLPEFSRIHLVDGSVLPTVPATTFTLTVMANAHRIATDVATDW